MNIGFFVRHFTERGTEIAIYDYAKYNEEILDNKSFIICFTENKQKLMGLPNERTSYNKFKERFQVIEINDIIEIKDIIHNLKMSFFYTLTSGGNNDFYQFENKNVWRNCKTIKHCVFDTSHREGDFYISISNDINNKYNTNYPVIPHIVDLPNSNENLRCELKIPDDAVVLGRYGGINEFNIKITHKAIIEYLNINPNIYFLFMNTSIFYSHPRIIYLEKNIDLLFKVKFINTCNAMIHSRIMGETFGLSIGEFSIKNKPIITCPCGDMEHIKILGDKAILYNSKEDLINIFNNIQEIINSRNDWNSYEYYTPKNIMSLFKKLIFDTTNTNTEKNCIVFEDGEIIQDIKYNTLWSGLFSEVSKNGSVINFIKNNLPQNTVFVIPHSDGNVKPNNNNNEYNDIEWSEIQTYIDYAKSKNKTFILGVLSHIGKMEKGINYLYIPLDDNLFENGINHVFSENTIPSWNNRINELCWRGGCSGINGNNSLRVNFVKKIFNYPGSQNVRLSNWWSENKNIPTEYFADRIHYTDFLKYKIFFIIDGNVTSSNYMWGFASGCVPFLISNSSCWFSELIKPYEHYIPVNYDLSNLIEQIEYIKNNDNVAEKIAKNALMFSQIHFSSAYQKKYLLENLSLYKNERNRENKENSQRKIIDCFTFYNELDLLYYRLSLLYEIVDNFVIVESNYTHAGRKKELFYQNNYELFKKFSDKIIHIVVDLPFVYPNIDYNKNEQWINENFQRNSINNGINQLHLNDNDLIIISDLDEICSPSKLVEIKNMDNIVDGFILLLDMYYYSLNYKHTNDWELVKIVTFKKYKQTTPQEIRISLKMSKINKCGWHLSYFGNAQFIKNKLLEFGHQEYNSDNYTNVDIIEQKIANGEDLFGRNYVSIQHINIDDNDFLPPNYNLYLNKYYKQNVPKIVIYFHICCINNWVNIVSNLFFKIKNSGLYEKVFEIRCVILGNYENNKNLFDDVKIKIIYNSLNMSLTEKQTINILYDDCKRDNFYVLYIHSKGVTHYNKPTERNVSDLIDYLSYFNIYYHSKCIELLKLNDAVGVNLIGRDCNPLHYSGNFWWSKSSHILKKNSINDNFYNSPEFWITNSVGSYVSLWNSNVHHNNSLYKFTNYENKGIKINVIT